MSDARGRILVVEDHRDLALGLRINLEEHGYNVHVAHTIADGLARLRQARPDLVILDLSLPDGDGLDLMRRLRAGGDATLILVLTAKSRQDAKTPRLYKICQSPGSIQRLSGADLTRTRVSIAPAARLGRKGGSRRACVACSKA